MRARALWLAASLLLAACSGGNSGEIIARDAWARPVPEAAPTSAIFMTLSNETDTDDRLTAVVVSGCETTELHQTSMNGGVMSMAPVDSIELPAGTETVLEPGGLHVMCIGVAGGLEAGSESEMTLRFQTAEPLETSFVVGEGPG